VSIQIQKDLLMHLSNNWEGFCGLTLKYGRLLHFHFVFGEWSKEKLASGNHVFVPKTIHAEFVDKLGGRQLVIGRGTTLPIYEEAESVSVRKMRKMRAQYSETHS
jgi:hypothetical protein